MAQPQDFAKVNYPVPAYNFAVTIDDQTVSFAEVSGLNREYETVTYRHGLSHWEGEDIKKFHFDEFVSVTMKKGVVHGNDFLFRWLEEHKERSTSDAFSMKVSLCDETGAPVVSWHVDKAIPVKLDLPSVDANSNDVAIESLEVKARGIRVEHH